MWRITAILIGGWLAVLVGISVGFYLWSPHVVRQFELVLANTSNNTVILDREGRTLATVEGLEDRHTVGIDQISTNLQKAVIAVEDRRFFSHRGMDPVRLLGALWANLRSMAYYQGGSTITQQLVKLTLLSSERTLTRKIKEIFMAVSLELQYPKMKLLEFYLNRVYLGNGLYGVEKASRAYFNKASIDLELHEAAFLAALIKKPEGYLQYPQAEAETESPHLPLHLLKHLQVRMSYVLNVLEKKNWLPRAKVQQAREAKLIVLKPVPPTRKSPYFVQEVLKELRQSLGISQVAGRGYRVYTTLDPIQQAAAEEAVLRMARDNSGASQAALVAMDTKGGYVRALVGGVDYAVSQFNRATQALRQPGSAFKPIMYAAALEKGITPNEMFVDEPVRYVWSHGAMQRIRGAGLELEPYNSAEEVLSTPAGELPDIYEPRNYNDVYGVWVGGTDGGQGREKRMTLARALERSSNVIAVQVLDRIGVLPVVRLARRMDISVRGDMGLCIALGCSETTLLDLTAAYGAFANGGMHVKPVFIRKVTNMRGDVLFEHFPEPPEQVFSPWTAFQMRNMLSAVIRRGTGRRARLDRPVGGKTGTNDGPRDVWFIGFSPNLVAGVWLGNDDNREMPSEVGGRTPARMWREFMQKALPPEQEDFPLPEAPYVTVRTCPVSGQVANPWCPSPIVYNYREREAPTQVCTIHFARDLAFQKGDESQSGRQLYTAPSPFARRLNQAFEAAPEEGVQASP
ncbi:MAG: transglycosylase domain-containing protein [SAR324 cluster bacterium]|nr:transglycosylase domain-containing protein [SAR324 cluster bacterium]